jgi:hypothetical protein
MPKLFTYRPTRMVARAADATRTLSLLTLLRSLQPERIASDGHEVLDVLK